MGDATAGVKDRQLGDSRTAEALTEAELNGLLLLLCRELAS